MANKKGSGARTSRLTGRSAVTGRFMPVEKARKNPKTTVVERLPLPPKK